ncbi:IclR family transcriptional regulator domain-containing protein [Burkholderia multivorans]|uniref:IclR family transcriptional regulator domain-containing protein n=1 Tax=Burkholderia multivorans TaxID=87883 RepID=UPI002019DAFA|nr:IclR family transcriptional regulator C-terminal domain-containing protein [Burkholderia multivorans]MCA8142764.1 helix-turn-helix domain-containing protein [Burkholderia multivorans]MCO1368330.1 helix-turn-helix domain-containing protein [Burkholderia multivorans]MCO1380221.1 helix-turn-helix domain-containing protein [Burkholderia multivorans]MDN8028881.1 IclR family transcriptional regulator C-terminal domain-containing protein [Burkholderia multivorans]UQP21656.1 helix-turn-helix domain
MPQPPIHERDLIVGLQKGLAIIQLFTEETPRLSVADVARLAGLTRSAARRFLLTLVHDGYVQTDSRQYWLTAKTLRIGQAYVDSARLPRMLRPIVEKVASETREHVSVAVLDGDEVVHIVRSRIANVSSMSIRQGYRLPMYCTGSGRLWLASLPDDEVDAYLARVERKPLTPFTRTSVDEIKAIVAQIREQGYVELDQEYEVGMRILGVPLTNRAGQMCASLTITTQVSSLSLDDIRERCLRYLYEGQALLRPIIDM